MAIYATVKRLDRLLLGEGFDKRFFVGNKCRLIEPGHFCGRCCVCVKC